MDIRRPATCSGAKPKIGSRGFGQYEARKSQTDHNRLILHFESNKHKEPIYEQEKQHRCPRIKSKHSEAGRNRHSSCLQPFQYSGQTSKKLKSRGKNHRKYEFRFEYSETQRTAIGRIIWISVQRATFHA